MTGFERLWNGWRSSYVSSVDSTDAGSDESGSVFTKILRSGVSDAEANIVRRGERVFAILNAYPYGTGHMLVLPYREVADLEDLEPDEAAELWTTVTDAVHAAREAYRPDGVNVGVNLGQTLLIGSLAEETNPEVRQERLTETCIQEEDISRLDVPMDDPLSVGFDDSIHDTFKNFEADLKAAL